MRRTQRNHRSGKRRLSKRLRDTKRRARRGGVASRLVFISGNQGKISELSSILAPITVVNKDIDLPEIQTTEVEEVVKEKVMTAWNQVKSPLFVEDTGLYITSPPMNGFPGALIKFYYNKLGLKGISKMNGGNSAYAESVIGYHDGKTVRMFKGTVKGTIATVPQEGPHGFGWDAIFIPDDNNPDRLSFAQMTPEMKNSVSMRLKAAEAFRAFLEK
jgi:XTP/dITP diphosphohydrolase